MLILCFSYSITTVKAKKKQKGDSKSQKDFKVQSLVRQCEQTVDFGLILSKIRLMLAKKNWFETQKKNPPNSAYILYNYATIMLIEK